MRSLTAYFCLLVFTSNYRLRGSAINRQAVVGSLQTNYQIVACYGTAISLAKGADPDLFPGNSR